MRALQAILAAALMIGSTSAQQSVSFPTSDGGLIFANLYGSGPRAVVLAHGGQFNKESWDPQAKELAAAGFRVLAFDFRGYGKSRGPGQADPLSAPLYLDILASAEYLRAAGATSISVVGASMGGSAAGDASILGRAGEIDRIVMLGAAPNLPSDRLKCALLIIVAREDRSGDGPRLPGIRKQFDRAPQPKELIVLDGSAHAQFLFQTSQGPRVMREILRFLSAQP